MANSPEENNAIARRFFDTAWNEGKLLDELIAPDAIDHSTVGGHPKDERGSESFRQIVGMFRHAMPDVHLNVEGEIYTGDMVVHRWSMTGTDTGGVMGMPPSNKKLRLTGMTIVRMRDGKIVERWAEVDQLGLLQQLGVVPMPGEQPAAA
jgi:steroid delta-isomerase-like uncharacterized protein